MISPGSERMAELLHAHASARLAQALEKHAGKEDAQSNREREKLRAEYTLEHILSEGLKYADQVQIATHLAKGIHPDMKVKSVTNLRVVPDSGSNGRRVSHHSLANGQWRDDATGNGAVNKKGYELHLLLQTKVDDVKFIDLLAGNDADAVQTVERLLGQPGVADQLIQIAVDKCAAPAAHTLIKQVYWSVSGDVLDPQGFHLLSPLFPSSLVHAVYNELSDARFGDANETARKARRDKKPHPGSYRSYPDLAVRKLGGSKPQNISQLNSERTGKNYLLSSSPPHWLALTDRAVDTHDKVFSEFKRYAGVNRLIRSLCELLSSNPAPTMETRQKRERIERALGEALADFGADMGNRKAPGWTRGLSTSDLPLHLQIWLDPDRLEGVNVDDKRSEAEREQDEVFRKAYEWRDWPDEVATDFALWLNAILRDENLPVGHVEVKHWAKQAMIRASRPATYRRRAKIDVVEGYDNA